MDSRNVYALTLSVNRLEAKIRHAEKLIDSMNANFTDRIDKLEAELARLRPKNEEMPRTLSITRRVINREPIMDWARSIGIKNVIDPVYCAGETDTPVLWSCVCKPDDREPLIPYAGVTCDSNGVVVMSFPPGYGVDRRVLISDAGGVDVVGHHIVLSMTDPDFDASSAAKFTQWIRLGEEVWSEV